MKTSSTKCCLDFNFLDRCKKVTGEYERLKGRWSAEAQVLHIIKEVCEFDIELRKPSTTNLMDEYADIGLTWLATGNYFNFSNEEINNAIIKKLGIVENRVKDLTR